MKPLILKLSAGGMPIEWTHWNDIVNLYSTDKILWSVGDPVFRVNGGYNDQGLISHIDLPPIVAVSDSDAAFKHQGSPALCRRTLYWRDQGLCMYCGDHVPYRQMEMEHIFPQARGGATWWTNVVVSCHSCNQRKRCRTPDEAGMRLLAVPFVPSFAEWMILKNRRILTDQMDYLRKLAPDRGARIQ